MENQNNNHNNYNQNYNQNNFDQNYDNYNQNYDNYNQNYNNYNNQSMPQNINQEEKVRLSLELSDKYKKAKLYRNFLIGYLVYYLISIIFLFSLFSLIYVGLSIWAIVIFSKLTEPYNLLMNGLQQNYYNQFLAQKLNSKFSTIKVIFIVLTVILIIGLLFTLLALFLVLTQ